MYNVTVVTTLDFADVHAADVADEVMVEVFTFDTKEEAQAFSKAVSANWDKLPNRQLVYTNVMEVITGMTVDKYKETLQGEGIE